MGASIEQRITDQLAKLRHDRADVSPDLVDTVTEMGHRALNRLLDERDRQQTRLTESRT